MLNAIAASGAKIDVFTLDTGRHFPETLDTLEASENRYGLNIRVMFPDAREVEELVARDGIYGFRLAVENRKACCDVRKVRPLKRALEGAKGWVTGLRREQSAGPRARAVRRVGRGERARQAQPDRRLEPRAARSLRRRQQRSRQSAARARLPVHRLPAVHARHQAGRGHPRRPLVVGERGRQGMRAAQPAPPEGSCRMTRSVLAPRHARGRGHPHFPRGGRAVPQAGADVFHRQGLDRAAAPRAQGVLAAEAAVPAAAHRHDVEVPRHDRLPRQDGARLRPRPHRAHERGRPEARHQPVSTTRRPSTPT